MPSYNDDAKDTDVAPGYEPTEVEIEAWAQRERERRESWLRGPTEAQKAEWAMRERARRLGQTSGGPPRLPGLPQEASRTLQFYLRDMQLAAEGAVSMMLNVSVRDVFDSLVRAGREWEDEYTSRPVRQRRVPMDTDTSTVGTSSTSTEAKST